MVEINKKVKGEIESNQNEDYMNGGSNISDPKDQKKERYLISKYQNEDPNIR